MQVTVKQKVCSTCPFQRKNAHQLTLSMIHGMLENGTISPCHQELKKYSGSETSGVEIYAEQAPVFKVCRGYVEARLLGDIPTNGDPLWTMLNSRFMIGGYSGKIINIREVM